MGIRNAHTAVIPQSRAGASLRDESPAHRHSMVTFRIALTAAVMAFVIVLAACLIFIQIATFRASARAAASAALDAASANTLSRLEADITELSSLLRVLSTNPSLADTDDRSEVDGAIAMFKAALGELPQTDSLHIGYENAAGCKSAASTSWTRASGASSGHQMTRCTMSIWCGRRPATPCRCTASFRTSGGTNSRGSSSGITVMMSASGVGIRIRSGRTNRPSRHRTGHSASERL
jgi:hypothetical protein